MHRMVDIECDCTLPKRGASIKFDQTKILLSTVILQFQKR